MNYYIYRHIRLDKNVPFYIGMGHNKNFVNPQYKRAYVKDKKSPFWENIVNKTNYRVEIVLDRLSKNEAINKEIEFIELYGRKDTHDGVLVNLTDGGDGSTNYKHSEKSREKNRIAHLGKKLSKETKRKMSESHLKNKEAINNLIERNKKITSESFSNTHKKNISKALRGKKASKEAIIKMREVRSKRPILQYDLDGLFIKEWKSGGEISRILGYDKSNIYRACGNKKNNIRNRNKRTAYGFFWEYKLTTG